LTEQEEDGQFTVMGPEPETSSSGPTNLVAMISNYTDRPDLLIAEIEKHDPGFVKRMNEGTEARAERSETARFYFGKRQAYASLALSIFAAVFVLGLLAALIMTQQATFWNIMGVGLVYAITQGGSFGFNRIIDAIAALVERKNDQPPEG